MDSSQGGKSPALNRHDERGQALQYRIHAFTQALYPAVWALGRALKKYAAGCILPTRWQRSTG